MKTRVSSHPLARRELIETAKYYERLSPGLGNEFLDYYESSIRQISENPESAPLVNRRDRRKVLRKFPFSIYYYLVDDGIKVLAVANQSRKPDYWAGRA